MSAAEMVAEHDRLALEREQPLWRRAPRDRARLGAAIAILRTIKPVPVLPPVRSMPKLPKPKPETPIRDAIVEVLSVVTHFQHKRTGALVSYDELHLYDIDDLRSVGLPYADCLARVKRKIPSCQVNLAHLRGAVLSARKGAPGYTGVTLADTRPHGMKGKTR